MRGLVLLVAILASAPALASDHATRLATLPASIRARTGTYARKDGPNCLNAVALWHGLTRKTVWTSWRALDRHLQDPTKFAKLDEGAAPRLGDVVVFRHGPRDLIEHGAVVVDEHFVWEKASADRTSPWNIIRWEASQAPYQGRTVIERYRRVE